MLAKKVFEIDIDIRKLNASPNRRIYWGSHHTIEKAIAKVKDCKGAILSEMGNKVQIRFVENKTGKVLKVLGIKELN